MTTGARNTPFGESALSSLTTGERNSAFGHEALTSLTTGSRNLAIGYNALTSLTTGGDDAEADRNTALGYRTLESLTAGEDNVALGARAMTDLTDGDENTSLGYRTLVNLGTGNYNVAVGSRSLTALTAGDREHEHRPWRPDREYRRHEQHRPRPSGGQRQHDRQQQHLHRARRGGGRRGGPHPHRDGGDPHPDAPGGHGARHGLRRRRVGADQPAVAGPPGRTGSPGAAGACRARWPRRSGRDPLGRSGPVGTCRVRRARPGRPARSSTSPGERRPVRSGPTGRPTSWRSTGLSASITVRLRQRRPGVRRTAGGLQRAPDNRVPTWARAARCCDAPSTGSRRATWSTSGNRWIHWVEAGWVRTISIRIARARGRSAYEVFAWRVAKTREWRSVTTGTMPPSRSWRLPVDRGYRQGEFGPRRHVWIAPFDPLGAATNGNNQGRMPAAFERRNDVADSDTSDAARRAGGFDGRHGDAGRRRRPRPMIASAQVSADQTTVTIDRGELRGCTADGEPRVGGVDRDGVDRHVRHRDATAAVGGGHVSAGPPSDRRGGCRLLPDDRRGGTGGSTGGR